MTMTMQLFSKSGYVYLCECQKPKNKHLPGKHIVLYRAVNMTEMNEFREMKGI